jgi:hypothetical protein
MTIIYNLYLKWDVFKSLIGSARTNVQIAQAIFDRREGADILFSRMLKGDSGCEPSVASELVRVINACIDVHRHDRKLADNDSNRITVEDLLYLPIFEFTRRLIAVAELADGLDKDALDAAHRTLLGDLAPRRPRNALPHLAVKRYASDRMFVGMLPSGGDGPIAFEAGRHLGQLTVEGITEDPIAAYAFVARDPQSLGYRLWDLSWQETLLWLPSPFTPTRVGETLHLMPTPQPLERVPGRFLVTAVFVFDRDALAELDPRGPAPDAGALDEPQTARFLTKMGRLAKRKRSPIVVATNEYSVVLP